MSLYNIKIFDYFKSTIKRTYLASPPLSIESEYKEDNEHLQTIIDNVIEEALRRGLSIIFEYRPRLKIFKTEINENSTIIMDQEFREKFKIYSINDIQDVIPFRSSGILIFPILPQLSPTGKFVYFGLFDYGELARFISAFKTALTVFGILPTFSVFYDKEKEQFVIKIFPTTYSGKEALVFCKLNPEAEFNIYENKIGDLGLTAVELDLLLQFVKSVTYLHIARIRSRFGGSIQLGAQQIIQDGDKLLSEAREAEAKFIENLHQLTQPPLPRWA